MNQPGAPTATIDSNIEHHHHSAKMPDPCTFSPREWETLSGLWHPVAWSTDVADEPVGVTLLDEDLVIYRTSGGARGFHRNPPVARSHPARGCSPIRRLSGMG